IPVNDDFSIAPGSEAVTTLLQFGAQFLKIVDLAVEHYPYALFGIRHGLVTTGQIDDRQPPKTKSNPIVEEIALIIRTTMSDRTCHPANRVPLDRVVSDEIKLSANAAHCLKRVEKVRRRGVEADLLRVVSNVCP